MRKLRAFGAVAAAILGTSIWVAGCSPSGGEGVGGAANAGTAASGEPIRIGLIASLNGDQQPWGVDSQRGAALAVEEFNAAGGVNGRPVKLIVEDTNSRPEGGKSATEKLIGEDRVIAVIGEVASGITIQAADVAESQGVPLVAVGATRTDLTEGKQFIFRACFTDDFQGAALAKFAYEEQNLRRVAVMTDRRLPYSTGLSNRFKQVFTALGGTIVGEEFYESGKVDFMAQLTRIKGMNPDGMFCSGYFTEVGPIARQRMTVGLNVQMLGGDGWDSTKLIDAGGEGIIGGFFLNHYHNSEQRPAVQNFVQKFQAKYGAPPATAMGALGYDATLVVLDALKRATELTPQAVRDAIASTKDLEGVSGSITIGPDGNAQKPALVLEVRREGFVPVMQIEWFEFGRTAP